jgi:hypothetical protein
MESLYYQCRGGMYGYRLAFMPVVPPRGEMPPYYERNLVLDWCVERFGPSMDDDNSGVWGSVFECIMFNNDKDAMLFKLQWC